MDLLIDYSTISFVRDSPTFKKMIAIAAVLVLFLNDAQAMSTGAPPAACAGISPQPGHGGSSVSLASSSPFSLNVTQLAAAGGYIPGTTYSRTYTIAYCAGSQGAAHIAIGRKIIVE